MASVRGKAIFEHDLVQPNDTRAETMLAAARLGSSAGVQPVTDEEVTRAFDLLRDQFGDDEKFAAASQASQLTDVALRILLRDHIQACRELEALVAAKLDVTEGECRQRYETERAHFELPRRYRARHIFVAAPDGTPAEVMLAKRALVQGLSMRLLAGEGFETVANEGSEDDATKMNGGDLNFFSAWRVSPEFFKELEKMAPDDTSAPFRSHLGFHIVRLSDNLAPRRLTFEEVRGEIADRLANIKRATAVAAIRESLRK
ncbi:MAG: peptidylprolyl isomerase [Chthoniobacterales bacterium]